MVGIIFGLLLIPIVVFEVVAGWKVFVKAGQPGWGCLIPIYSYMLIDKIAGKPDWWVFLYFVPFVNIVVWIKVSLAFARAFGKDTAFGVGLMLFAPIFVPILAFSDAKYIGMPGAPGIPQNGGFA